MLTSTVLACPIRVAISRPISVAFTALPFFTPCYGKTCVEKYLISQSTLCFSMIILSDCDIKQ